MMKRRDTSAINEPSHVHQRGRPKRRRLDNVWDDMKEKGLSAEKGYDRATGSVTISTLLISGTKMKKKTNLLIRKSVIGCNIHIEVNKC